MIFLVVFGGKMERAQVVGPCPEKSFGSHVVPDEGFDVALKGLACTVCLVFGFKVQFNLFRLKLKFNTFAFFDVSRVRINPCLAGFSLSFFVHLVLLCHCWRFWFFWAFRVALFE